VKFGRDADNCCCIGRSGTRIKQYLGINLKSCIKCSVIYAKSKRTVNKHRSANCCMLFIICKQNFFLRRVCLQAEMCRPSGSTAGDEACQQIDWVQAEIREAGDREGVVLFDVLLLIDYRTCVATNQEAKASNPYNVHDANWANTLVMATLITHVPNH